MNTDMILPLATALALLGSVLRSMFPRGGGADSYFKLPWASLHWVMVSFSILGSMIGAFMIFGLFKIGYQGGITGYVMGASYIVGFSLLVIFSKRIRALLSGKSEPYFVVEGLLADKFGRRTVKTFLLVSGILFLGVLAAQFIAIYAILSSYSSTGMLVSVLGIGLVGTIFYTILRGFRGVVANDLIQGVLLFCLAIALPLEVYTMIPKNVAATPAPLFGELGIAFPLVAVITLVPAFLIRADIWTRLVLARPSDTWKVALLSACGMVLFYGGVTWSGATVREYPEIFGILAGSQIEAYPLVLMQNGMLSMELKIAMITAALFAILSSVDSYLHLVGSIATQFLVPQDVDVSIRRNTARMATVGVALFSVAAAIIVPNIVDLLAGSFALLGVLSPVVITAAYGKKKFPDWVGYTPMVTGGTILLGLFGLVGKLAFLPGLGVGVLSFGLCYWIGRKHAN